MRKEPVTLFGQMVEAGGLRAASRALGYLGAWAMTSNKLGHPASVDEFVLEWRSSRATTYREREALEKSLPDGWTIQRMLDFVWANRRSLGVALGGVERGASVMRAVAELRLPV